MSELRPTLDSPVASVLRIVRISNDNSVMRINSKRMMINFELGPQLLIVRINSKRMMINFELGPQLLIVCGALLCMIPFANSTNSPTNFVPII